MFIRNRSKLAPVLAKGHFARDLAALSVSIRLVFDVGPGGALTPCEAPEPAETDPPDVRRRVLWRGTSVTAFATVDAPSRPPFARTVRLSVADRIVDLAVYGDRRWGRRLGRWVQSEPERFERLPLTWERAFGGTVVLEPHLTRAGLPHPGGPVPFPLNPMGRGLLVEGAPIEGTLLPNIEHPRALIASPSDTPVPHGFAPCPALFGLRADAAHYALRPEQALGEAVASTWTPLRMVHHAPGWLVFDEPLEAGTPLELLGHAAPVRVLVPGCPARIATRFGRRSEALRPRVRSVHLDGDTRQLSVVWGHSAKYHPRRAPQWIELEAA